MANGITILFPKRDGCYETIRERIDRLEHHVTSPAADQKQPPYINCRDCGTQLLAEVSKASGYCIGCTQKRKQIGPDRPRE